MEELIAVAVVAVVYIIRLMSKLSSTEATEDKQPRGALGEVFPMLEALAQEPVEHPQKQKSTKKQVRTTAPVVEKASMSRPSVTEPVAVDKKERFTIKGKSDAKKAIIYSEIFNRKYN